MFLFSHALYIDNLPIYRKAEVYNLPREVLAQEFSELMIKAGYSKITYYFRYLDVFIDDFAIRSENFSLRHIGLAILKDAKPADYLPKPYHDFLNVFDRK